MRSQVYFHHMDGEITLTIGQEVTVNGEHYTIDEFDCDGVLWLMNQHGDVIESHVDSLDVIWAV